MPTFNRRHFISRSIECFLAQDYSNIELIVLDDGTDPVKDLISDDSRIKYIYEQPRRNHGEKMNRCAELAKGELLAVWDDDDFYAADRLTRIVRAFEDPTIEVVGSSTLYYQDGQNAYQYTSPVGWLASISFRRSAWERRHFDPLQSGADWTFQQRIPKEARLDLFDPKLVTAAIHPNNACPKNISGDYKPVDWAIVKALL